MRLCVSVCTALLFQLSFILVHQVFLIFVTCGQVWLPILEICALHLTHPKCTHTAVNTHTPWTHTRSSGQPMLQWAANAAAPEEQLGVRCLAQGHLSRGIEGGRECCTFTPPHLQPPLGYKSDSLTIRPRLPSCCNNKSYQKYKSFINTIQ